MPRTESSHVVSLCESECLGGLLYSFGILHFEKITRIVENGDLHFSAPGTSTHLALDMCFSQLIKPYLLITRPSLITSIFTPGVSDRPTYGTISILRLLRVVPIYSMYPRGPGRRRPRPVPACVGVACGGPTDRPYSVLRRVLLRVAVDSTGNRWKPVVGVRAHKPQPTLQRRPTPCDGRTVSDV